MWFFFFKHKTAYELRISDWSSDVCSSDLTLVQDVRDLVGRDDGAADGQLAIAPQSLRAVDDHSARAAGIRIDHPVAGTADDARHHRNNLQIFLIDVAQKIGSASCGERVCRYV